MLKAIKGNRAVRIEDNKQKAYESLGYTIKTLDGKTVFAPVDKDAEIKRLTAEVEELKKKLAEVEKQPAKEKNETANEKEAEKKPVRKRTKKAAE